MGNRSKGLSGGIGDVMFNSPIWAGLDIKMAARRRPTLAFHVAELWYDELGADGIYRKNFLSFDLLSKRSLNFYRYWSRAGQSSHLQH